MHRARRVLGDIRLLSLEIWIDGSTQQDTYQLWGFYNPKMHLAALLGQISSIEVCNGKEGAQDLFQLHHQPIITPITLASSHIPNRLT